MKLVRALPAESNIDPDTQLLACCSANGGGPPGSREGYRTFCTLDELNAGAHYLMALCREHAGDRDAAVEHDKPLPIWTRRLPCRISTWVSGQASARTSRPLDGSWGGVAASRSRGRSENSPFGGGFTREALVEFCRASFGVRRVAVIGWLSISRAAELRNAFDRRGRSVYVSRTTDQDRRPAGDSCCRGRLRDQGQRDLGTRE